MKKIDGQFILSNTDVKRIEAHTRALARKARFDGDIKAYLDTKTGEIWYEEFVGYGGELDHEDFEFICYAPCYSWRG